MSSYTMNHVETAIQVSHNSLYADLVCKKHVILIISVKNNCAACCFLVTIKSIFFPF